jgi:hypothetical protein
MGRTTKVVSEVHEQIKERAKEIWLNIRDEKQKKWYKIGEEEE